MWCHLLCGTAFFQSSLVSVAAAIVDRSSSISSIVSITSASSSTGEHHPYHHLCVLSYDELPLVQQVCKGIDNDDDPHHHHPHRYDDHMEQGYELRVHYKDYSKDYNYEDFLRAYQQHTEDRQQQQQQGDVVVVVVRIKLSVEVEIAAAAASKPSSIVSDVIKVLNSDVDR